MGNQAMDGQSYPEQRPETADSPLVSRFTFDATAGVAARKRLEGQVEELEQRIASLAKRADNGMRFSGVPLVNHIMSVTHSAEEFQLLAGICTRLSSLLPKVERLRKQLHTVSTAMDDPAFMADIFGDFSDAIPGDLQNLMNKDLDANPLDQSD